MVGAPARARAASEGSIVTVVDNAIYVEGRRVASPHELDKTVWTPNPDPKNGRTVFHTGTIHGGTAMNIVVSEKAVTEIGPA